MLDIVLVGRTFNNYLIFFRSLCITTDRPHKEVQE